MFSNIIKLTIRKNCQRMKNTTANKDQESKMKTLKMLAAATALVVSSSATAGWGPFDNDNRYNNNGYNNNNWDNNAFGDVMNDMMGDMDMDMDMEMKFKVKGKGRGNGNNYWNGYNNYNGYNHSGYNYGYAPYGYQPYYGYAPYGQAPVQTAPAGQTTAQ
jgi:hypothetical protein